MRGNRKKAALAIGLLLVFLLSACGNDGGQSQVSDNNNVNRDAIPNTSAEQETANSNADNPSNNELTFPLGMEINSDAFTGTAYIKPMISRDDVYRFPPTNNVTFEPGARSSWHNHGGMIILVTGGVGYYQEEGKPAQIIRKGDVIECAPGVRHWHGATPDNWFSQIVIFDEQYTGETEPEEPVTDEYYANLDTEEYAGRVAAADGEFMFPRADETITIPNFNGPIYLSTLIGADNVAASPELHYVIFEPGVVNNWHTHEGGQILIATDGIGYHQTEGQSVEILYPGDVAYCPPGVKHWHGGSANTAFAHIAVNTNPERSGVEWFDRISDEEYSRLPIEKADVEQAPTDEAP